MDPIAIIVLIVVGILAVLAFFWMLEVFSPLIEIVAAVGLLILVVAWFRDPPATQQLIMVYVNSLNDFAHHLRDLVHR